MADDVYLDLRTPKLAAGEPAYAFELARLDGEGTVRLADYAGAQPVALVFGSYT